MYWNNCWFNNFNRNLFFNKTLFIESIFFFLFTDRILKFFFKKRYKNRSKKVFFFKFFFKKRVIKKNLFKKNKFFFKKVSKKRSNKILRKKYNFSKLWFVKYNNYILLSVFCFFYFRVKKKKRVKTKKKKLKLSFIKNKVARIFWRKKKGQNLKRKKFLIKNYLSF